MSLHWDTDKPGTAKGPYPLAEHDPAGRVRYLIANRGGAEAGISVERQVREVPIVTKVCPSLHRGQWFSGWVACLNCFNGWIAIAPIDDVKRAGRGLECLGCGSLNSAPVLNARYSACGHEQIVAQPDGAPSEGCECEACHAMAVLVEAA